MTGGWMQSLASQLDLEQQRVIVALYYSSIHHHDAAVIVYMPEATATAVQLDSHGMIALLLHFGSCVLKPPPAAQQRQYSRKSIKSRSTEKRREHQDSGCAIAKAETNNQQKWPPRSSSGMMPVSLCSFRSVWRSVVTKATVPAAERRKALPLAACAGPARQLSLYFASSFF